MPTTTDLSGRVVAITGGARGIGLATARALRARGATVATGDLDGDGAVLPLDVCDPSSYARFLDAVEREHGLLDALVNNAGIMPIGPFLEESDATARKVMEVNVLGCMTGMKLALPAMLERGTRPRRSTSRRRPASRRRRAAPATAPARPRS